MPMFHRTVSSRFLLLWVVWAAFPVIAWANDPKPEDRAAQISQWIAELGHRDYFTREKAQEELAHSGFEAFDALSAAAIDDDLEVAARARYLLRLMQVEWTVESDSAEVKRLLKDYEAQTPAGRLNKMKALAAAPGGMVALCRLARFEQSVVLSKHAAIEILTHGVSAEPPSSQLADTLRVGLGSSRQPAAHWLRTYLRFRDDPTGALDAWKGLIEAEQAVLRRAPNQTDTQIVATLVRMRISWLEKFNRNAEAIAAVRQLIDMERGDVDTLVELVDWLLEKKAWQAIDDVAASFAKRFAQSPILIYTLAEVQAARGNKQRAEEMAELARKLDVGAARGGKRGAEETAEPTRKLYSARADEALAQHVVTGKHLWQRGRFAWAEREFRDVIAKGKCNQLAVVTAAIWLSEMLHDKGDDLSAAKALQELVDATVKIKLGEDQLGDRTLPEVRSRMHFFDACHWERQGDRAKQRKALDAALEADATDVDVLIACYRLPHPSAAYHRRILDLIQKSAQQMREQIADSPDDSATLRNQIAWLIGNTEGDYDEAIKHSQISIEQSPDIGGYYDTLARCYYAKGDCENAVKNQTKAAEMEPHSGLIAGQLRLFQKAAAEQKAQNHRETHPDQRH